MPGSVLNKLLPHGPLLPSFLTVPWCNTHIQGSRLVHTDTSRTEMSVRNTGNEAETMNASVLPVLYSEVSLGRSYGSTVIKANAFSMRSSGTQNLQTRCARWLCEGTTSMNTPAALDKVNREVKLAKHQSPGDLVITDPFWRRTGYMVWLLQKGKTTDPFRAPLVVAHGTHLELRGKC